jgi:molecular chaperone GrpE
MPKNHADHDTPDIPDTEQAAVDAAWRERLAELQSMAAAGELEAPAGAEELAEALADAVRMRDALARERDDLADKLLRAAADFQNYQRRAANNEREASTSARVGVVQAVVPVLDHFSMALNHDPAKATAAQVLEGVTLIRGELLGILARFGVETIEPKPNDEFDPTRHEALLHQPAEGVAPGHVSACHRVGYALGERVIRPAQVAVAPGA